MSGCWSLIPGCPWSRFHPSDVDPRGSRVLAVRLVLGRGQDLGCGEEEVVGD